MGRPRNEAKKNRVFESIEAHYRSFFRGVGLHGSALDDALDYALNRGFTKEWAARLALAGGKHRTLLNEEKAA